MRLVRICLILIFGPSLVLAEDQVINKAVNRARHALVSQSVEHEKVLRSLYKIGRQTHAIVREKSRLEQDKIGVEAQIKSLVEKIRDLEEKLKTQKSGLLGRLNSIQRFNSQAWTQFLFQAKNSAQLERNVKYLGLISQHDLLVLKEYSSSVKDFSRQKDKFAERLAYLNHLEHEIALKEKNLREQNDLRSKVLAQIRQSQRETLKRIRVLQKKQAKNSAIAESGLLDAFERPSFFERKGLLSHPVDGIVVHPYGLLKDTATSVVTGHRGWFYGTAQSSRVRSVFEGQVVHSDRIPEYGRTLVVDHGDHFYTVYAGLADVKVKDGDMVKENQILGSTSTSPYDGKVGLYFEIRHFSETVDPKVWMKGRAYEITDSQWNR